jgi:hypothetical protein
MEPIMLFSTLVLAVAAMHLISQSVEALRGKNRNLRTGKEKSSNTTKRSDWYMFFKLSDLLGPDKIEPKSVTQTPQKTTTPQRRPEKRLQL